MVMNFCCAGRPVLPASNAAPASASTFTCTFILLSPSWTFLNSRGVRRTETADRGIDRVAEPFDDRIDLLRVDDEWRREQHMVAARAVDGAAGRIDHHAARHCLALDARIELELGIERRLRRAILDELDTHEQAASADVADVGVI